MSYDWYEVFDNEEVNFMTRHQAAQLGTAVSVGILLTFGAFALAWMGYAPMPLVLALLVGVWFAAIRFVMERLRALHRMVWCIKISDRHIVGYDYTRKQTLLDWTKVARVDLGPTSLGVYGEDGRFFEVSHVFPDFAVLSHRVAHYAEFYGIPVCIDGQPFKEMNVYTLFPFLSDEAPGSAAA